MRRDWIIVTAATGAASLAATAAGLPAPTLFAGLAVGMAFALSTGTRLASPRALIVAAQATIGVTLGAQLKPATLESVAGQWPLVGLVVVGTLLASLAAGLLVATVTGVDRPSALLGLVAGGASGLVTMSDELGADDRLVAFMQYSRVLVVVVSAPLVVALALDTGGTSAAPGEDHRSLAAVALLAVAGAAGLVSARRLRVPTPALLGPLVVTAALTLAGADTAVPPIAQAIAFAVVGAQVGLRFTPALLRYAGRLLPTVLAGIVGLIAVCAGLALLLTTIDGLTFLDAYLATTPGGIYAVLATAVGSGANTTFVLAVQTLRMVVMIVAAPPLVRLLSTGLR